MRNGSFSLLAKGCQSWPWALCFLAELQTQNWCSKIHLFVKSRKIRKINNGIATFIHIKHTRVRFFVRYKFSALQSYLRLAFRHAHTQFMLMPTPLPRLPQFPSFKRVPHLCNCNVIYLVHNCTQTFVPRIRQMCIAIDCYERRIQ